MNYSGISQAAGAMLVIGSANTSRRSGCETFCLPGETELCVDDALSALAVRKRAGGGRVLGGRVHTGSGGGGIMSRTHPHKLPSQGS